MTRISRLLSYSCDLLEKKWISHIASLGRQGMSCGEPAYDDACLNLRAASNEFIINEDD
jgi:hypothetical protein